MIDYIWSQRAKVQNDFHFQIDSRPSDVYMRHQPRLSLVQIMACRLVDAKPLSKPMLEYC